MARSLVEKLPLHVLEAQITQRRATFDKEAGRFKALYGEREKLLAAVRELDDKIISSRREMEAVVGEGSPLIAALENNVKGVQPKAKKDKPKGKKHTGQVIANEKSLRQVVSDVFSEIKNGTRTYHGQDFADENGIISVDGLLEQVKVRGYKSGVTEAALRGQIQNLLGGKLKEQVQRAGRGLYMPRVTPVSQGDVLEVATLPAGGVGKADEKDENDEVKSFGEGLRQAMEAGHDGEQPVMVRPLSEADAALVGG